MLDPVILFFLLGAVARVAGSDLRLPEALYEALSIYLLIAIGLKGGAQLAVQPLEALWPIALAAIALSALTPVLLYPALRGLVGLDGVNAAAIAAHYGSVSVVTFAVAQSAMSRAGLEPEAWLAMLVALMEAPGIIVGVMLARRALRRESLASGLTQQAVLGFQRAMPESQRSAPGAQRWAALLHEVVFGKALVLLLGGLAIGWIVGPQALAPTDPFFLGLFKGVLALFLLELGLVVGLKIQLRQEELSQRASFSSRDIPTLDTPHIHLLTNDFFSCEFVFSFFAFMVFGSECDKHLDCVARI